MIKTFVRYLSLQTTTQHKKKKRETVKFTLHCSRQHLLSGWDYELRAVNAGTTLPPAARLACGSAGGSGEATCLSTSLPAGWARITTTQASAISAPVIQFSLSSLHTAQRGASPCPHRSCQSNSSWAGLEVTPLCQGGSVSAALTAAAILVGAVGG